jgi:DNA-binding transcriptional LysR family regulator
VSAGVGVSFVSSLTVQHELQDHRLAIVALKGFRLRRPLHVVQALDQSVSAAVRAFLDLLDEASRDHR